MDFGVNKKAKVGDKEGFSWNVNKDDETMEMVAEASDEEKRGESDDDNDNDNEKSDSGGWWWVPEPILLHIFHYLPTRDVVHAGATCRRWWHIANDDFLWKHKFQLHYGVDPTIQLKAGAESWKSEYKRLTSKIPFVQSQCLEGHSHQVLHVSFSHNGEMFATCSKDGFVIIWNSTHPCSKKYSHNMKQINWKYTQYSQFNQSDTLLLVSGVHFGSPHSTSGEIAVFTVDGKDESFLRCRVVNRPYDIFGTWFSDQYLISGDLQWLAHLLSRSVLWLYKANQEIGSEHVPIMDQLYKFYNRNASSVRAIMIAKCPWLDESNDPLAMENESGSAGGADDDMKCPSTSSSAGNPPSHAATLRRSLRSESPDDYLPDILQQGPSTSSGYSSRRERGEEGEEKARAGLKAEEEMPASALDSTIRYLEEYRHGCQSKLEHSSDFSDDEEDCVDGVDDYEDDMENSIPKYLIFSTGSKTYTPHQIGIKRIRHVTFPKKLDPGPSLKERIAAKKAAEQQNEPRPEPDWWNFEAVADRFDKVDKVIDLHGHIIGMALSPDHRYLYVNSRPWPKNYVISNALEPPPIAEQIDIHVIDLMTLKRIGNMLHAHKAYTPSSECFFIFLDVCDNYVASGAEDMHAYLWDRYYGICLAKYKHTDVVNSVAFNPSDSEMLVTTSDDYTIKIWRSRAKAKEYNIDATNNPEAFELKQESPIRKKKI